MRVGCAPAWLKMLSISTSTDMVVRPKSAAQIWFLCSFADTDEDAASRLFDAEFLSIVSFRFEKQTGMARLHSVDNVDFEWSTGCSLPMPLCVGCSS